MTFAMTLQPPPVLASERRWTVSFVFASLTKWHHHHIIIVFGGYANRMCIQPKPSSSSSSSSSREKRDAVRRVLRDAVLLFVFSVAKAAAVF